MSRCDQVHFTTRLSNCISTGCHLPFQLIWPTTGGATKRWHVWMSSTLQRLKLNGFEIKRSFRASVKNFVRLQPLILDKTYLVSTSTSDDDLFTTSFKRKSLNILSTEHLQDEAVPSLSMMSAPEEDPMSIMNGYAGQDPRIVKGPTILTLNLRQRVFWANCSIQTTLERTASPPKMA